VHLQVEAQARRGRLRERRRPEDAGVVDDDVDAAELAQRGVDDGRRALVGRDVGVVRDRCSAGAASPPVPSTPPPRSLTTTCAPRDASSNAYSRPSPWPAPVTIATRPSKRSSLAMDYARDGTA
jgi:hypothetical protein